MTRARIQLALFMLAVWTAGALAGVSITPWPRDAKTHMQAALPFTEGDNVYFALQVESTQCTAGGEIWFKEPNGLEHLVTQSVPAFGSDTMACPAYWVDAPPYHASLAFAHDTPQTLINGYKYLTVYAWRVPGQTISYDIPIGDISRGNLNYDATVDYLDLLYLVEHWGPTGFHIADLTNDGVVNIYDLVALISYFGDLA